MNDDIFSSHLYLLNTLINQNVNFTIMSFAHYDLGNLSQGQTVVVTLGNAANVLLLDDHNFRNYRNRQRYSYRGGHVTTSPYRVGVPNYGHWHIVIDLGGRAGTIRADVRVI